MGRTLVSDHVLAALGATVATENETTVGLIFFIPAQRPIEEGLGGRATASHRVLPHPINQHA